MIKSLKPAELQTWARGFAGTVPLLPGPLSVRCLTAAAALIPLWSILSGINSALLIGEILVIRPATRFEQLNPVEALRHE
jgi:ABC-type antimicrobial peptide transport system permease subunit